VIEPAERVVDVDQAVATFANRSGPGLYRNIDVADRARSIRDRDDRGWRNPGFLLSLFVVLVVLLGIAWVSTMDDPAGAAPAATATRPSLPA